MISDLNMKVSEVFARLCDCMCLLNILGTFLASTRSKDEMGRGSSQSLHFSNPGILTAENIFYSFTTLPTIGTWINIELFL